MQNYDSSGALVEDDLAAVMQLAARVELWVANTSGGGFGGQGGKKEGKGRGEGYGA